jgi:hypothetical protein
MKKQKVKQRFMFVICSPNCRVGDELHNRLKREVQHLVAIFKKEYTKDFIKPEIASKIIREKVKLPALVWDDGTIVYDALKPNMFDILTHVEEKIINDRQELLSKEINNEFLRFPI